MTRDRAHVRTFLIATRVAAVIGHGQALTTDATGGIAGACRSDWGSPSGVALAAVVAFFRAFLDAVATGLTRSTRHRTLVTRLHEPTVRRAAIPTCVVSVIAVFVRIEHPIATGDAQLTLGQADVTVLDDLTIEATTIARHRVVVVADFVGLHDTVTAQLARRTHHRTTVVVFDVSTVGAATISACGGCQTSSA